MILVFSKNICNFQEKIAQLLMFESSNYKAGTTTSLAEYVGRMQTDQKHIYYLFAPRFVSGDVCALMI